MEKRFRSALFTKPIGISTVILLYAAVCSTCLAQTAAVSAGGEAEHSSGSISYSIGQAFYEENSGLAGSVWEGVQQPYEISRSVGLFEESGMELYPNPTSANATLYMIDFFVDDLFFVFFDFQGRLLYTDQIQSIETIIPMEMLAPGAYLLTIFHQQSKIRSYKIIKF
jgi:hypothetical protein